MEMSTRVYVTGVLADELAQRPPEVPRHQAVHNRVDGRVRMTWKLKKQDYITYYVAAPWQGCCVLASKLP